MSVRQAKGKKHLKYIKRKAMRLWKETKWQPGLWDECLKTALKDHRERIQSESLSKDIQEQMSLCDRNGWIG
jgi:hypothetical protein